MTNIVERLRAFLCDEHGEWDDAGEVLLREAADEIERLRERVTEAENRQGVAEHMQANLHNHIKRLEDENARWTLKEGNARAEAAFLRAENSRLKFKAQGDCQEIRQLYAEIAKLRNAAPDENNLF